MGTDHRADRPNHHILEPAFRLQQFRHLFRLLLTVSVADKNGLLLCINAGFFHLLRQLSERLPPAFCLPHRGQMTFIVHMSPGGCCSSFAYDPLKRVPPRPATPDFSRLKDDDFVL